MMKTNDQGERQRFSDRIHTLSAHCGTVTGADSETVAGTPPLVNPIYQASVFTFQELDKVDKAMSGKEGYVYSRLANPNSEGLAADIRTLEGAEDARVFASGLGGIYTSLGALLEAGDHVVAARELYGGTYRIFNEELPRHGIEVDMVDTADLEAVERAFRPTTRLVYTETISNPTMGVAPLAGLAELAHAGGALLMVDNTFASPVVCRPLELGADIVVESATKYLSGHGDVLGGAVAGGKEAMERVRSASVMTGATLDPFAAWLIARGVRTLALRMERHCSSAKTVARWLVGRNEVGEVYYPGLDTHPQHAVASEMFAGLYGGMLSFVVPGGLEGAQRFVTGLDLITFAPSLADVTTTITHPALTSHRDIPAEQRRRLGIEDGLIRLSVGIESPIDIITDLETGLAKALEG